MHFSALAAALFVLQHGTGITFVLKGREPSLDFRHLDYVGAPLYDCRTCPESQALTERLSRFDWEPFEEHLRAHGKDVKFPSNLTSKYLDALMPWIENAPTVKPRHLKPPDVTIDCANPRFQGALSGRPREKPVRVMDFVPFGYELDLLEIRLHELDGLVETHVVAESTRTHRFAEKPLFLKRNMARFASFWGRLVDLIMSDEEAMKFRPREENKNISDDFQFKNISNDWRLEVQFRRWMWQQYVKDHGTPSPNDLLIHGDIDEIPSREVVAHLKYCELQDGIEEVTVESDFYRMNFDWLLGSAAKLWFPKVYKAEAIIELGGFPRSGSGDVAANASMPGGAHLNRFGSPALLMYKHLALAEGGRPPRGNIKFMKDPNKLWPLIARGERECCDDARVPLNATTTPRVRPRHYDEKGEFIPWFADLNWKRYPHLFPKRAGALKDHVPSAIETAAYEGIAATMKKWKSRVKRDIAAYEANKTSV